ncbi:hypothetical protein [Streptomyces werraensis]|uniref:hypothetical protein n=1 Tax=Streptomyces werraensis TaxID=68284 RepID=UPI001CE35AE5
MLINKKDGSLVVIVTGAGSGIGRAGAAELARAGHTVYAAMPGSDGRDSQQTADLRAPASAGSLRLTALEPDRTPGTSRAVTRPRTQPSARYASLPDRATQIPERLRAIDLANEGSAAQVESVGRVLAKTLAKPRSRFSGSWAFDDLLTVAPATATRE